MKIINKKTINAGLKKPYLFSNEFKSHLLHAQYLPKVF